MKSAATPLRAARLLEALCTTRFGSAITVLGRVTSTSDLLLELAQRGAPDGAVLCADAQTSGRGRRGAHWYSPARQGLWMSCLLRDLPAADALRLLAPATGVAVASMLRAQGVPAALKWPNDVIFAEGKLAGILVDAVTEGARCHAVIGIGLNLITPPPQHVSDAAITAIGLDQCPGRWLREELLIALLRSLETELSALKAGHSEALRHRYLELDALRGREIIATTSDRVVAGTVVESDPVAGLLVATPAGHERLDPARSHVRWVAGLSAGARPTS